MKSHAAANGHSVAHVDAAAARSRQPLAALRYFSVVRTEVHAIMLLAAGHLALLENAVAGAEDLLPLPLARDWTTQPLTFGKAAHGGCTNEESSD